MLILGAVGLQIRLSDYSIFNVPLDLWSLANPARLDLQSDRNEYKHF